MSKLEKHNVDPAFEDAYLAARSKEGRVLDIVNVARLPYVDSSVINYKEWKKRQHSFEMFRTYFEQWKPKRSLDLACGNGWLINKLHTPNLEFVGVEINEIELSQAQQLLLNKHSVDLILGDIFSLEMDSNFDCIVISAALQYFEPLDKLIDHLLALLSSNGQLHILDTPLYNSPQVQASARERTEAYYNRIGTPNMIDFYHHHLRSDLDPYNPQYLYDPDKLLNRFKRKFLRSQNPFPWVCIKQN